MNTKMVLFGTLAIGMMFALVPGTHAALGLVGGSENFDTFGAPNGIHKMAPQDTASELVVFGNARTLCGSSLNQYYYAPTTAPCVAIPVTGSAICVGFLAPVFNFAADFHTGWNVVNPAGIHMDTFADPECKVPIQQNAQSPNPCYSGFIYPGPPTPPIRCSVTSATPIGGISVHDNGNYWVMDTTTWM